jgi:hypothetical protein
MFAKFCEKLIFLWWIGKDKTCLVKFLFLVVLNLYFYTSEKTSQFLILFSLFLRKPHDSIVYFY